MAGTDGDSKACAACGRRMEWRRRWARNWEQVRYCSDACRRRRGQGETDRRLEFAILDLLGSRASGASICPSEAAREVGGQEWRRLMGPARAAARRLVARGQVLILQRGRMVDPSRARGAIRIALPGNRRGRMPITGKAAQRGSATP